MDALLGRWAKDIETIVADLDDRDAVAKLELMKVRESFEQFELQP